VRNERVRATHAIASLRRFALFIDLTQTDCLAKDEDGLVQPPNAALRIEIARNRVPTATRSVGGESNALRDDVGVQSECDAGDGEPVDERVETAVSIDVGRAAGRAWVWAATIFREADVIVSVNCVLTGACDDQAAVGIDEYAERAIVQ
jgi:hypothetical protein